MAKYTITHICGHISTQNIVGPEKDRASKAKWMADRNCYDCHKADQATERATATADAAESTKDMVSLAGSEKQIVWATTIRASAVATINAGIDAGLARGLTMTESQKAIIDRMLGQVEAKFWIDNRALAPSFRDLLILATKLGA
jgi:hypothetical protein